ncbi:MAG: RNA polymerase sigma factor [Planctomycetota bacterium]
MENITSKDLKLHHKQECEELIKKHWHTLWTICYKLTLNKQEAEYLIEEICYRVVKYFKKYDPTKPFIGWIWSIAVNSLKTYKKNKTHNLVYLEKKTEQEIPDNNPLSNTINIHYLSQKIAKCLETLKPIERAIFCMKYFEEKKYPEISRILQLNENTTRVYFLRAKEKMKRALGGWIYEL